MRKLKLRVGGLELEYECEPEELPTIISGVLEAVGPRLLQNGGGERMTKDPPQAIEVYIRGWPSLEACVNGFTYYRRSIPIEIVR